MNKKIIMKLENIDKFYEETGKKLHILRGLNLEVEEGEFISILGRSGSGKSTLLNVMGLLDKVDGGKIFIDEKEVSNLKEDERNYIKNNFISFIFQFHYLLNEFTALENVMIPALLNNKKWRQRSLCSLSPASARLGADAPNPENKKSNGDFLEYKKEEIASGVRRQDSVATSEQRSGRAQKSSYNFFKLKKEVEQEAKRLLEIVGLGERINHKPNQLSGGEKQRVAIARAMINKPNIILADEPTGNLDEETSEVIFSLFKKLNKEFKQTIIVVTHARDLSKITDRQLYLKKGIIE